MSLVEFTRLGSLTAPAVTGSAADLPTLVKFEDFTATMLANLDAGGGDLRFSSNEAGTTQLACEVVTFTKATGDVVWIKVPSVSTGALIYVWGDNTGAIQPAVDAAFGRNAVWVGGLIVNHLSNDGNGTADEFLDSTGNTYDGRLLGGTATRDVDGYLEMLESQSVTYDVGVPMTSSDGVTLDFKFKRTTSDNGVLWSSYTYPNYGGCVVTINGSGVLEVTLGTGAGGGTESRRAVKFATGIAVGEASHIVFTYPSNGTSFADFKLYKDGITQAQVSTAGTANFTDIPVKGTAGSGSIKGASGYGVGAAVAAMKDILFALEAKSPDQIAIEYDNQSAVGAWWTAADEPSGGAINLTPTTINSNSQSFNPTLQYASLLSLTPGVVNSASSTLNAVIQYSASLLLAPSVVNSASSALNPALQYASVVLLEPATVNSSSSALNPNISFSASLNIFPTAINSTSSSLDPVVKYISALDLLPGAVNSNSVSLDPVVNYTSILNISPSVVNSNSVSFNPSIDYTSALILSPVTVDSSSVSLDPLVEYKAVINITSQLINSASVSLNPSISTGATQDVGLVSAGFANDLYSVQYEASGVTASYQLSNITVNFKG